MKKIALIVLLLASSTVLRSATNNNKSEQSQTKGSSTQEVPVVDQETGKTIIIKLESFGDNSLNMPASGKLLDALSGFALFGPYKNLLRGLSGVCFVWATSTPHLLVKRFSEMRGLSEKTLDFTLTLTGTAFIITCLVKAGFEFRRSLQPSKS